MHFHILNKYLAQQKIISIPGLGALIVGQQSAHTNFVDQQMEPIRFQLQFHKLFDAPDKDFYAYIADLHGIADFEAIKAYNQLAYDIRSQLRENGSATWPGLGVFKRNIEGEVLFEPFPPTHQLYPSVIAKRIVRGTIANHPVLVGDREVPARAMSAYLQEDENTEPEKSSVKWWIVLLVMAAILGIAFLIYHLWKNGMLNN
jgi:hypothetical protein